MSNQNQLTANNYGGSGPTLDQLLAQNIGITMPTPASTPSTSDSPGYLTFRNSGVHGYSSLFVSQQVTYVIIV
jgi:PAB1-binding protein PBP1